MVVLCSRQESENVILFFNDILASGHTDGQSIIVTSAPFERVSLVILKHFILSLFLIQLSARGPDTVHGNITLCIVHQH